MAINIDNAFPIAGSNNQADKLTSEFSVTNLVRAAAGHDSFILENDTDHSKLKVVIYGYYFELSYDTSPTTLYIYVSNDADFPEIVGDGNNNFIFTSSQAFVDCVEHSLQIIDNNLLSNMQKPYFISAGTSAPSIANPDTNKIWIKSTTFNPYVYYSDSWVPLGAVYK